MVECRYRGKLIGWLVAGADGFLAYRRLWAKGHVRYDW